MDIDLLRGAQQRQLDMSDPQRQTPAFVLQRAEPAKPEHIPSPKPSPPQQSPTQLPSPPPVQEPVRVPQQTATMRDTLNDFANFGDDDDRQSVSSGQSGQSVSFAPSNSSSDDRSDGVCERPSPGFRTIEEEKNDLLFKLHRSKKAGMPVDESYDMSTPIADLRSAVARCRAEVELDSSIKFQRKMLTMFASGVELMNKRFDPFGADLDGYGEHVHESITDYDEVFAELHEKYRGSFDVSPEIKLIFMLASSMFMFNLTKTLSKKVADTVSSGGQMPGGLAGILGGLMGGGANKPVQPQMPGPAGPPPTAAAVPQRRTMRGPTQSDSAPMFNTQSGTPRAAVPLDTGLPPQPEPMPMPRFDDGQDDRMSDIVSESGSERSMSSMDSEATISDDDDSIQVVNVPAGRGRGRGARGGRGRGGRAVQKSVAML